MYDYSKAEKAIKFIESLKHSQGEWRGQRIKLEECQKEWIRELLKEDDEGNRIYNRALFFLPRKNGKSFINSGLGLYFLCCDSSQSNIICAASTREQAQYIFDECVSMVKQNKTLSSILKVRDSRKTIYYPAKNSVLKAISADADSKHGGNISHILADEIHVWPDSSLWDVLTTGQAARKNRLAIAITTAGRFRPEHFCYKLYCLAKAVKANPEVDKRFLPIIYEYLGEDYKSENSWKTANPLYGIITNKSYFEDYISRIEQTPSELNTFLMLHLNQWVNSYSTWLSDLAWKKCGVKTVTKESLIGRNCYAGLDLAAVSDLCCLSLLFPNPDGSFDTLLYTWVPKDSAIRREHKDKVPYLTWQKQNYIEFTEGDVIDYAHIRKRINEIGKQYKIKELAIDTLYQGIQTATDLQSDGFNVVSFGQGYYSMAVPTKELEKLVTAGKLNHGNNPVLSWNAGNAIVVKDDAGNLKISKAKSTEKVDGLVATVMALGRAMATPTTHTLPSLLIKMN